MTAPSRENVTCGQKGCFRKMQRRSLPKHTARSHPGLPCLERESGISDGRGCDWQEPVVDQHQPKCIWNVVNQRGSVPTAQIQPKSVSTVQIQPKSVSTAQIQPKSVSTVQIQPKSVPTVQIQPKPASTIQAQQGSLPIIRVQSRLMRTLRAQPGSEQGAPAQSTPVENMQTPSSTVLSADTQAISVSVAPTLAVPTVGTDPPIVQPVWSETTSAERKSVSSVQTQTLGKSIDRSVGELSHRLASTESKLDLVLERIAANRPIIHRSIAESVEPSWTAAVMKRLVNLEEKVDAVCQALDQGSEILQRLAIARSVDALISATDEQLVSMPSEGKLRCRVCVPDYQPSTIALGYFTYPFENGVDFTSKSMSVAFRNLKVSVRLHWKSASHHRYLRAMKLSRLVVPDPLDSEMSCVQQEEYCVLDSSPRYIKEEDPELPEQNVFIDAVEEEFDGV